MIHHERELPEKRRLHSKTFDQGDGRRFRLEVGRQPIHYVDKTGRLVDIDLTPRFDPKNGCHCVDRCGYDLRIADADGPAYRYVNVAGKQVEVVLDAPATKMVPVGDDGLIKWAEIAKDSDYVITPKPLGCATFLYLRSADAPREWSWRVRGDAGMIRPIKGWDDEGRRLRITETREDGVIRAKWTGLATSRRWLRKKKNSDPVWTDEVTYPVIIDPTINENIVASSDDASSVWANGTAFYQFRNSATNVGMGNLFNYATDYSYQAGFRFQTIALPVGSTINSATLTLRVMPVGVAGSPNVKFFGNAVDDAAAWTNPGNLIHNMTKTTASQVKTSWTVDADNTVDVTSIIAEIAARAGWASGNDMAIAGFRNGGAGAQNYVVIAAFDHPTLTEARLSIDYTAAANPRMQGYIFG